MFEKTKNIKKFIEVSPFAVLLSIGINILPAHAQKVLPTTPLQQKLDLGGVYKGNGFKIEGVNCTITAAHVAKMLKGFNNFINPNFDIALVSKENNINKCLEQLQEANLPENLNSALKQVIDLGNKESQLISSAKQKFTARLVRFTNNGSTAIYVVNGDPGLGISGSSVHTLDEKLLGVAIEVDVFFSKKTITAIAMNLFDQVDSPLLKNPNIGLVTTPLSSNYNLLKKSNPNASELVIRNLAVENTMRELITNYLNNDTELQNNLDFREIGVENFVQGKCSLIRSLIVHKGLFNTSSNNKK